jgi:serine/threonine protein kinase/lipopolysaccharide biosynthesis regulator YciM
MKPDFSKVKAVFLAAAEMRSHPQRNAYVEEACGTELALRQRVDGLLRAHDEMLKQTDCDGASTGADPGEPVRVNDDFSVDPPVTRGMPSDPKSPSDRLVIDGKYKVLEQIGEGGMGTVYLAEQLRPVRRKVALKLIKPGLDSSYVSARFEAERQALAMMNHDNIARVFDGGIAEGGRPYFVMEYVKGIPLTHYCDSNRLTIRERLELFVSICGAVQHAHQKGIIHRDLKPGNILIALYDGKPKPKIIDFGLAKALHQPLTEQTMYTSHGMAVGTAQYMSPEQAEFNNLDIDTRTDIYCLGVVLYELLTGTTPLDRKRTKEGPWNEVLRIIREEEPPKPSTKLSQSAELPGVAARCRSEPARLSKLLRGDLDWVVMKALEKERSRRYESADSFGQDVLRYLNDEPVSAGAPGAVYRIRKFVRKHKGKVFAAALILALLVLGGAGTSVGWVNALRQERRANQEAANARAVADFFSKDIFAQLNPFERTVEFGEHYKNIRLRTVLQHAARKVSDRFPNQPEIEAAVQLVVGKCFLMLEDPVAAEAHLQRAIALGGRGSADSASDYLESKANIALVRIKQAWTAKTKASFAGTLEEAETIAAGVASECEKLLGPDHRVTIHALLIKAHVQHLQGKTQADEELEALALRQRRNADPEIASTLRELSRGHVLSKRYDQAESLLQESMRLTRQWKGETDLELAVALNSLGALFDDTEQFAKAEEVHLAAVRITEQVLGKDHPTHLVFLQNLAYAYYHLDKLEDAARIFSEVTDASEHLIGDDAELTLASRQNLASVYHKSKDYEKAVPIFLKTLESCRKLYGDQHENTQTVAHNLAMTYREMGKTDKADEIEAQFKLK